MTLVQEQLVDVAVELVSDELQEQGIEVQGRLDLMNKLIEFFPEYETEIRSSFAQLEQECRDAELNAARLQREFFESRWV